MQLDLEYDPNPPFDTGSPNKVPKKMRKRLKTRMEFFLRNNLADENL
ncbi:MAG: hypothetical protein S4CHLAM6_00150 [Chlamydiae bacterium]|nr:hypothetical protein [Chlamydiota bacterium]